MAAGFKRPVANENHHLPPKHDQIAERAQGHRPGHGNSPIPIHGSGGNQNRHEHYAEPQHDAQPVENGRRKTPLAKAKNALKDLLKVSLKVTIRVTVSISITITGIGIAANNRHVETAWNSVRNLSYIPGFVAEIVDFAHETSNSALRFSDAMLHPTLPHRPLPPPAGFPRPIPYAHQPVYIAPESWCVQTKSIWASNPSFFPALPIELRENNCQHWGISAP